MLKIASFPALKVIPVILHVKLEYSRIQIGSYFKDGHDYGSGGKAYGVTAMEIV